MRALVTGWFSFELMGATAGDLLARDVACTWLERAGYEHDVAHGPSFAGGVDWRAVDPNAYTHLVFVCGPLGNGEPVVELFERFRHCRLVGLDVSMLQPLAAWNPFDALFERESDRVCRPDISFASELSPVPVVGVVLVHDQKEYPGALHGVANAAIAQLCESRPLAVVRIDTCFDPPNSTGLRTPAEVEAMIARMDAVVTTRLHGLVLALKHGVPALAIDPIAGGAKLRRQAEAIGWNAFVTADRVSTADLADRLDWCLTAAARVEAAACGARARDVVEALGHEVVGWLSGSVD
ncbi:MAG: polysaccharide pyruvyl transferase family protein [Actinomycetota bacterium]